MEIFQPRFQTCNLAGKRHLTYNCRSLKFLSDGDMQKSILKGIVIFSQEFLSSCLGMNELREGKRFYEILGPLLQTMSGRPAASWPPEVNGGLQTMTRESAHSAGASA